MGDWAEPGREGKSEGQGGGGGGEREKDGILYCFMFVHSTEVWTRQFPHPLPPASSSVASKHEELEMLYASVARVVSDGLSSFEKASSISTTQLQCTLMVLKAACNNDHCYIDRLPGSGINSHCLYQ